MIAVRFQGIYLIYIFVTVVTATIPYFLKKYLQNIGLGIGYECFNNFALYVQLLILTSYIGFGYLGSRWNISFQVEQLEAINTYFFMENYQAGRDFHLSEPNSNFSVMIESNMLFLFTRKQLNNM